MKLGTMAWSAYQNKIFDFAANPDNGSFVVKAVAGSGKTTTCIECAKRIVASNPGTRVLFLAFNKSIVEELRERMKDFPSIRCSTMHALGLSILGKVKVTVNENKYKNWFMNKYQSLVDRELDEKKKWAYIFNCTEILRLCRIDLVAPGDTEAVEKVMAKHSVFPVANEATAVASALKFARSLLFFKTKDGYEIDYTDMVTLPLTDGFRNNIFKYDVVFIDEAQDLSRAQQALMLRCVKPGKGKFIAVGDPSQSIVGFAGAMCDSFDKLAEIAGTVLPLSVNYRCGRMIVESAKSYVPEIEACEDAPSGSIEHTRSMAGLKAGDMVICRKTNPLIMLALKLMANGVSCFVKGKDIAESIVGLIEKAEECSLCETFTMDALYAQLDERVRELRLQLLDRGIENPDAHPLMVSLSEKADACRIVGQNAESPDALKKMLLKIFDDREKGDAVALSTVHKAKGLEADTVYIICPELIPYSYPGQQEWEAEQERNLAYVAITRAKRRLVYVDVPEKEMESIVF